MEAECNHRLGECRKVAEASRNVWKKRKVITKAKMGICMIDMSVLYDSETWEINGGLR